MAKPSTGNYLYASDLGQRSIEGLIELARSSGVPFTVGSAFRPGDPGWHGQENAIDIFSSVKDMTRLAYYLVQYAPYLGELLYTPPTATQRSDGRWVGIVGVDNGVVLNSLSDKTAREHGFSNAHVHLAATNSGLRAAAKATPGLLKQWQKSEKERAAGGPQNTPISQVGAAPSFRLGSKGGCLQSAAILLAPVLGLATFISAMLMGE